MALTTGKANFQNLLNADFREMKCPYCDSDSIKDVSYS